MSSWNLYSHEADIGVCGSGATKNAAFEQAALAMTSVVTDPESVADELPVTVACEAPDDELLLVDWLNALVYEMATRKMLFSRFEVHTDGGALAATAWGEPVDREKHQPAVEIKGATYTDLHVGRDAGGAWVARCVVDV